MTKKIVSGISKMSPVQESAHLLGLDLANEAYVHDISTGMPLAEAEERRHAAYMLGRNTIEEVLGAEHPFAADRIEELRETHNQ